jgi:transcriptional antiterminator NusG
MAAQKWYVVHTYSGFEEKVRATLEEPTPVQDEEVEAVIQQIEKGPAQQIKTQFDKGDNVRIIDGSFSNFNGFVDEVDADHNKLKVMVTIFGRQTPVELNFLQVEKA